MKRVVLGCAVLMTALGSYACKQPVVDSDPDGTDTGNPLDEDEGPTTGEDGGCDVTEEDIELGAQTPLGFAPQAVLDWALGQHTQSLAWLPGSVDYGPESGRSEITVDIEAVGTARLLNREPRQQSGEGPVAEIGVLCQDSVEIDVRISVDTAGGALAEQVEGALEATASDFASARFSLDLTDLAGSFEASLEPPPNSELTSSSLAFELGFSEYGAVGAISLYTEFQSLDGSAVGQGGVGEIAHFPAENYCGPRAFSVTTDQKVRGLSMASALERLNAMSPSSVEYTPSAPSSELTLTFDSAVERVCANLGGDGYGGAVSETTLEFPGSVTLFSADSRVDGSIPLQITAQSSDGSLQQVRAEASDEVESLDGAAALPGSFGIQDSIDFSGYDGGRVSFQSVADGPAASGQLLVEALDIADCVTNPPEPDPDGMSSPGCRGTDRIQLWSAIWERSP